MSNRYLYLFFPSNLFTRRAIMANTLHPLYYNVANNESVVIKGTTRDDVYMAVSDILYSTAA